MKRKGRIFFKFFCQSFEPQYAKTFEFLARRSPRGGFVLALGAALCGGTVQLLDVCSTVGA